MGETMSTPAYMIQTPETTPCNCKGILLLSLKHCVFNCDQKRSKVKKVSRIKIMDFKPYEKNFGWGGVG